MHATTLEIDVTYVFTFLQGLKDIADSFVSRNGNRLITDGSDMMDGGPPRTLMRYELDSPLFFVLAFAYC